MKILLRLLNRILKSFEYKTINGPSNVVYLTFDDGPEEGITEFVLDELSKYGFKATFFCRGDNALKNGELLNRIISEGHAIGNHTYSHLYGFNVSSKLYCEDVKRASQVLNNTNYFRPPHGSLTIAEWCKLCLNKKIFYWSLNSGDSDMQNFDEEKSRARLKNTKAGDIILFHFCAKHERETRILLPKYLAWLKTNKFVSDKITV